MQQKTAPIKTRGMQVIERQLNEPIEVFLERRYLREGATTTEIGVELKLNESTISRWLRELSIPARLPGQRADLTEASVA
jgi:hypothetical protein